MRRKPRRRPVHYCATGYRDGAVVACFPERKPSDRRIKEYGLRIDDDLVSREIFYGCDNFAEWELDFRVRVSDLLANRLNMRRTTRDLILPELASIHAALAKIVDRLDRLEATLSEGQGRS